MWQNESFSKEQKTKWNTKQGHTPPFSVSMQYEQKTHVITLYCIYTKF